MQESQPSSYGGSSY